MVSYENLKELESIILLVSCMLDIVITCQSSFFLFIYLGFSLQLPMDSQVDQGFLIYEVARLVRLDSLTPGLSLYLLLTAYYITAIRTYKPNK